MKAIRGVLFGLGPAILLWFAIITGCNHALHAQSLSEAAFVAGSSFDTFSTVRALKNPRLAEGNPLLSHGGTSGLVAGKAITTGLLVICFRKMEVEHPKLTATLRFGGGIALSMVAANNLKVNR